MKTFLALISIRILFTEILLLLAASFISCEEWVKDNESEFPGCAGVKYSFNPDYLNSYEQYYVTITGEDAIAIEMFFTDYVPKGFFISPSYHLWIESVVDENTKRYYDGYCYERFGTLEWFGSSAIYFDGRNTNCDFEFDIFTCSEVSGTCFVYIVQPPDTLFYSDTLVYSFEGTR